MNNVRHINLIQWHCKLSQLALKRGDVNKALDALTKATAIWNEQRVKLQADWRLANPVRS